MCTCIHEIHTRVIGISNVYYGWTDRRSHILGFITIGIVPILQRSILKNRFIAF